ncbi:hypothetical protein P168DRAFT_336078 [Aspergillus campestris IBT 28561]|uniref:Uncharacterized protein n=1 Tax=Aspergillus campestris (strain IBT 28561) TaxID=1392248 RepID=A0A2I1CS11_ASPC2|nr:uncharacterized protein P168DRAFT_336078 [Aspergillus campestris IBT 28561]PKY00411.1 hypothetical protein P168DRAFT_336078 [Aspergillus campestris IBT 28561]
MVNLLSFLLAAGLVAEVALAKRVPYSPGGWSDATHCPATLGQKKWHCDDALCGGEDPDKKGHCKLMILQRLPLEIERYGLQQPMGYHAEEPCECTTGDEDGNSGVHPIVGVIPFIIPIGFLPPPPGVPHPKDADTCPMDYTEVKCKDCKALEHWCTVGDHAGCPCTDDCPADGDDNMPDCDDDGCQGVDEKCVVGLHKDCKCKDSKPECPNLDEKYLNCEADYCKGEKKDGDDDTKCTADEARLINSMIDSDEYGKYSFHFTRKVGKGCKTTCKDAVMDLMKQCELNSHSTRKSADGTIDKCGASYSYSITASEGCSDDATGLPGTLFRDTLTDDFCGAVDEKKELEWAVDSSGKNSTFIKRDVPHFLEKRTPPANSKSYTKFKTTLKFAPTNDGPCTKSCKDAFYTISQGKCGVKGNQQNMMATNGALDVGCGTYSYEVRWTGQKEIQKQHCHDNDEFPDHTDTQTGEDVWKDLLWKACGAEKREELKVIKGKKTDLHYVETKQSGTFNDPHDYKFSVYWVDGCELDGGDTEQSHAYPLGKDYRYKGKEVLKMTARAVGLKPDVPDTLSDRLGR